MSEAEPSDPLKKRLEAVGSCPAATLFGTGQVFRRRFDRDFKTIGLTSSQFTLLSALGWAGETSVTGLTRYISRDQTTLSRGLEGFRQKGWVQMVPDPEDRRIHRVKLTEDGRKKLTAAMDIWEAVRAELEAAIGAEELDELIRRCRAALSALAEHDRRR